jgi:hypothetical protein
MTLPGPDPAQIAPDLIGIGAQAIVDNAKRLGLTWTLTLATVTSINPVQAITDGDTVIIGMTSMIGPLTLGQRVYVIQVPPSGNFIVGSTSGARPFVWMHQTVQYLLGLGVAPVMQLDVTDFDNNNMADLVNDRAIIRTAGFYEIVAQAAWATESTGTYRGIMVTVNGPVIARGQCFPSGTQETIIQASFKRRMVVGDFVQILMFQGAFVNTSPSGCWLQVYMLER